MRWSNLGGTCDHCHNYCDTINYTADYGTICNDCSLELTRQYFEEQEDELIDKDQIVQNWLREIVERRKQGHVSLVPEAWSPENWKVPPTYELLKEVYEAMEEEKESLK